MKRILSATLAAVLLTGGLAGCGSGDGGSGGDGTTLTVLAASSLTETFDQLKKDFEADHDGVTVKIVYDSSATLAQMAEQGAPGDVLATADQATMDKAKSAGGTQGTPQQFASNVVQVAVPTDNPGGITSFADLGKPGVKYVVCVETAPCGAAAARLLKQNGVTAQPVSQEVDVKSVLGKVTSGEADAGFVYKSDVQAAGAKVKGIEVPGAADDPNTYWVSVTKSAKAKDLAGQWIDLMTSSKGQQVLGAAGFGAPTG